MQKTNPNSDTTLGWHSKTKSMKDSFQIEFVFGKISQGVLWKSIGTADGLAKWFADRIDEDDKTFTFHWGKSEQKADLIQNKANTYVRFRWEEDEGTRNYFEMRIDVTELSEDVILTITDFCESDDDQEELTEWWNSKISELQKATGI